MNKNTKRRSVANRAAVKQHGGSKSGIMSASTRKNVDMIVCHNTNESGAKHSITRFTPMDSSKPGYKRVFPKVFGGGR